MEQQQQQQTTAAPTPSDQHPTEPTAPKPSQPPVKPSPSLQQPPPTPPPPSSSISPNPNPKPPIPQQQPQPQQQTTIQTSQSRPPFNRPSWAPQQPQPPQHFSQFSSSAASPPCSSAAPPSMASVPPPQRGGMAIGVPATPPPSFSSPNPVPPPAFSQQFSSLARNPVNIPDSGTGSTTNQVRPQQPMQQIRGMGMMGSLGATTSTIRPSGLLAQPQHRPPPIPSSLRPQTNPNNQSAATQNFQGHNMLRAPIVGSTGSALASVSQSSQPHNQPWLPSGSQGKPLLGPPSYRPQLHSQSLPPRSITPPTHHIPMTNAQQQQQQQQQHTSSAQPPQSSLSQQPQEHYGQQISSSRAQQSLPHQQQVSRVQGLGNQKLPSQAMVQPSSNQTLLPSSGTAEPVEICNRILSKRSIQELLTQIDPLETLDPEVEDVLVDIADEFVESITTFGCSLAKHRKSNTLEAKDILLHLERNWNMTLPGFSGDEIKGYRKLTTSDIHRERLAVIKRSMTAIETTNAKSSANQATGNAKGHLKAPANIIGSPNPKMREAV